MKNQTFSGILLTLSSLIFLVELHAVVENQVQMNSPCSSQKQG